MSTDRRKPLDPDFIEAMRERIKCASIIDKLQACIDGTAELSKEQVASARILLAKRIPDLKAIEHTGDIGKRELTREEMIERITQLHTGSAKPIERSTAPGTGAADGTDQARH